MLPTTRDDAKTDQDLTFENTAHRRFYAWTKTPILDVSTNNGLHMHGIILANRWGRLTDPLDVHFRDKRATYVAEKIRSIHVVKIKNRPQYTTDYAGKGLKRLCFNAAHILILPRTLSELADFLISWCNFPVSTKSFLFWAILDKWASNDITPERIRKHGTISDKEWPTPKVNSNASELSLARSLSRLVVRHFLPPIFQFFRLVVADPLTNWVLRRVEFTSIARTPSDEAGTRSYWRCPIRRVHAD